MSKMKIKMQSGRTMGRMYRASRNKSKPSSESRPLRVHDQIAPRSDKDRYRLPKYREMDNPIQKDEPTQVRYVGGCYV